MIARCFRADGSSVLVAVLGSGEVVVAGTDYELGPQLDWALMSQEWIQVDPIPLPAVRMSADPRSMLAWLVATGKFIRVEVEGAGVVDLRQEQDSVEVVSPAGTLVH